MLSGVIVVSNTTLLDLLRRFDDMVFGNLNMAFLGYFTRYFYTISYNSAGAF